MSNEKLKKESLLPDGWEVKKLGDICDLSLGKTPYRKDRSYWDTEKSTNNVWLSIADMLNTEGKNVSNSKEYISDKATTLIKIVRTGTLLVSFKLTLGRLAFAGKDLYTNEAIAALPLKSNNQIDKFFLYHYLNYFDWDKATDGDIKVKGRTLNKAKLKEIDVYYPKALLEQKRIVGELDNAFEAIDKAKDNAEQNLENAQELFQSKLQSIFDEGKSKVQTGEWQEKTLSDVALVFGRGKSKHRPRNWKGLYGGEYPFIQTGEVRNANKYISEYTKTYNETGLAQSKLWEKGTICITIAANIAETSILEFDACFPDSIIGLQVNPIQADLDFTYYLLQYFKNELQKLGKGSAQDNINLGTFENKFFPFPKSVIEQKQIVQKLDTISSETTKLEVIYQKKIENLEELKKSVLQKAFSGEL